MEEGSAGKSRWMGCSWTRLFRGTSTLLDGVGTRKVPYV